jgi:hypothetical protein
MIENHILGLLRVDSILSFFFNIIIYSKVCQAKNLGNYEAYIAAEYFEGIVIHQTEAKKKSHWASTFQT